MPRTFSLGESNKAMLDGLVEASRVADYKPASVSVLCGASAMEAYRVKYHPAVSMTDFRKWVVTRLGNFYKQGLKSGKGKPGDTVNYYGYQITKTVEGRKGVRDGVVSWVVDVVSWVVDKPESAAKTPSINATVEAMLPKPTATDVDYVESLVSEFHPKLAEALQRAYELGKAHTVPSEEMLDEAFQRGYDACKKDIRDRLLGGL